MDLNELMKQAKQMQEQVAKAQEENNSKIFESSAGGDLVKLSMSGKGEMLSLAIDPSLLKEDDGEILADLIIAAFNKAKQDVDDATQGSFGDLGLPPGFKMPF